MTRKEVLQKMVGGRKVSGRSEAEVQAGILGYLAIRGDCFFWRQNVGGVSPRPGVFIKFGVKGLPDILCVLAPTGRLIGIEVKRENGGSVSKDQRDWGAKLTSFGGIYIVARSVADVTEVLGASR